MFERYTLEQETLELEITPRNPVMSGIDWVASFPTSRSIEDLEPTFRESVRSFVNALTAAGAGRRITSTRRPRNRAYLMHWSWRIAKKGFDPRLVPRREGVNIAWWHGDEAKSRSAARAMVAAYGMDDLKVPPSLMSRHIDGQAVDMAICWTGNLEIAKKGGSTRRISSSPRDHTNPDLIEVAKTYGVIHFKPVAKDRVHWSIDGG